VIAWTPFQLRADFLVISVYHGPYVGHEISFRCFEAEVDRFCVFTDDDTAARVVSSGEKEIIGSGRH